MKMETKKIKQRTTKNINFFSINRKQPKTI